jgi:hypothetical protein
VLRAEILRFQHKCHAPRGPTMHDNRQAMFKGNQGLELRSTCRYG